jgi:hypothetical protein
MTASKYPRHDFWGAGEPDCPKDLKGSNGELHTMRCKVCGDGWRESTDVCMALLATLSGGIPGDLSGELTAICKGLVAAVAVGDNRKVIAMFDAPEHAHAFVRYLQRFMPSRAADGVTAARSEPKTGEPPTESPSP